MAKTLTDQQKQAIADELLGSAAIETISRLEKKYGVDDLEIRIAAEEMDVVECEGCNWFCESGELDDDLFCTDCQDHAYG